MGLSVLEQDPEHLSDWVTRPSTHPGFHAGNKGSIPRGNKQASNGIGAITPTPPGDGPNTEENLPIVG